MQLFHCRFVMMMSWLVIWNGLMMTLGFDLYCLRTLLMMLLSSQQSY